VIIILGLIILVAAVVVGVAGVLGNGGTHGLAHGFSVLGYHLTGSGTVFLYGIAVGAVALFGLWLLLAGVRHASRRGRAARRGLRQSQRETAQSRQETAAVSKDRDDLIGQRDTARASTASTLATALLPATARLPLALMPATATAAAIGRACSGAGPPHGSPPPRPRRCGRASPPPTSWPVRLPPQSNPRTAATHEYRQEVRAQGRSGQRQRQAGRRPAHRQPSPAR
jgi:hypothetical protein